MRGGYKAFQAATKQSRRDATPCSAARQCRVGLRAEIRSLLKAQIISSIFSPD
jgi:hypothetical protein